MIEKLGHKCFIAPNGETALREYENNNYDVIFMVFFLLFLYY